MRDAWAFAAIALAGIGLTWLDLRRLRRHRTRNDGGQCAHCGSRLESWRVRQVGDGGPLRRRGIKSDVCLDCHAGWRRRRLVLYLVVPPLAVVLLILLMPAIVNGG